MASVRQTSSGKYELCISNKLLPKRIYLTFDSADQAATYGKTCAALFKVGVVPPGLVEAKDKTSIRLSILILEWMNSGAPAISEVEVLNLLLSEVGNLRLSEMTYLWAQSWVQSMKLHKNYSPGTIRKRIGALSRCYENYLRQHPDVPLSNPLRLLPKGTSAYSASDAKQAVALGKIAKVDVVRERRLMPGEFDRIISALNGFKRDDKERPMELKNGLALKMIFLLIVLSGSRLREAYMLKVSQVKLDAKVITLKSSKQWHGREKFRDVPMRRELYDAFQQYFESKEAPSSDLVFPWWDGDVKNLGKTTATLSSQFGRLLRYAQCEGLTEHDLRHEATCSWYELKTKDGNWMFREKEIDKIMGWAPGSKMSSRYASFRADDLAKRLYD